MIEESRVHLPGRTLYRCLYKTVQLFFLTCDSANNKKKKNDISGAEILKFWIYYRSVSERKPFIIITWWAYNNTRDNMIGRIRRYTRPARLKTRLRKKFFFFFETTLAFRVWRKTLKIHATTVEFLNEQFTYYRSHTACHEYYISSRAKGLKTSWKLHATLLFDAHIANYW